MKNLFKVTASIAVFSIFVLAALNCASSNGASKAAGGAIGSVISESSKDAPRGTKAVTVEESGKE